MVKNWQPHHEQIVFDRLSGMTNTQISDKYNIHESAISNIVGSKQGRALKARITEQIHAEKYATIPEQRKAAIALAQQRMYDFLERDDIQQSAPVACAPINARFFEVLMAADKAVAPTGNTIVNNIQMNVLSSPEKRDALAAGLERMREVAALHSGVLPETVEVKKELVSISIMK